MADGREGGERRLFADDVRRDDVDGRSREGVAVDPEDDQGAPLDGHRGAAKLGVAGQVELLFAPQARGAGLEENLQHGSTSCFTSGGRAGTMAEVAAPG